MTYEIPDNPNIQEAVSLINKNKVNQALDVLKEGIECEYENNRGQLRS